MGLLTAKWAGITGHNTEDLQGLFDCEQETVTMCQEKRTLSSAHAEPGGQSLPATQAGQTHRSSNSGLPEGGRQTLNS